MNAALSPFDRWVKSLCESIGIEDWNEVARTQRLVVEGESVQLQHMPHVDPGNVCLALNLGAVDDGAALGCLQQNFFTLGKQPIDGFFAIDPASGELFYRKNFRLANDASADQGRELLDQCLRAGRARLSRASR